MKEQGRDMNTLTKTFVKYVLDFYGKGGIYDFGANEEEVLKALNTRLEKHNDIGFGGDSLDRELVRDIILENRGEEPLGLV